MRPALALAALVLFAVSAYAAACLYERLTAPAPLPREHLEERTRDKAPPAEGSVTPVKANI
jgi:hypothetical protein